MICICLIPEGSAGELPVAGRYTHTLATTRSVIRSESAMKHRVPMLLATLLVAHQSVAAESFELQALITAARREAAITIYAPSGKIVDTAAAFCLSTV